MGIEALLLPLGLWMIARLTGGLGEAFGVLNRRQENRGLVFELSDNRQSCYCSCLCIAAKSTFR